jgi:hypothetical protein
VGIIHNGWLLLFFSAPYTTRNYQVLCLNKLDGVMLVNRWYPRAVNAIWLPHCMDAVVAMVHQRKLSNRPILHQLILSNIGKLAEMEGCVALAERFSCVMEANDYFIDKVIENYLRIAIENLKRSQRVKMKGLVHDAMEKWVLKRNERRCDELYLGRLPFHEELKRCCGEFYSALKHTWGCCPIKVDYFK